ncbi:NAD(P)/FAD-dependent oxidoreductase [Chryseobacterium indologenes]|uniref:NAD(P)/FAD-dependent oxidoreductase n=1 Tax=Chryseobacterium indologenes TaxID=253 RepID=UPI0003E086AD|nr:NAD(P)/FAD-dependent oxidoreductase [Chryseobacterium indologenes]QPQ51478.1 NAD(P)/FAD-dependent oxidoreductase [Chryseobacterium indologenes]GAE65196.1 putative NADH dehydrogenase [Chryseobacterium indologenes NBRC 14944]SFI86538.1 NADH dehydrogenase [Chryseobacterium indologenes]SUX49917.1 NADH dehydrogenase-like protein SAV0941 [Chryseobacterium indologenes]
MKKHIVIVGGGFAGINLIKSLRNDKRFKMTLVDKNNYHFFPPLIYQVATSFIEASNISYPFRKLFSESKNVKFHMGTLIKVNPETKSVETDTGTLTYDYLVLAVGTESNFFGMENVRRCALPMKSIEEALYLRNHILLTHEEAARNKDMNQAEKLQNIVIAGGGPTGVELAGMLAEMGKYIAKKEYPEIKLSLSGIYLIDALPALLSPMSKLAQEAAYEKLKELGVKILLNVSVKDYVDSRVILSDGNSIETETLIWTSGVIAREVKGIPEESIGRGRRILVDDYNKVQNTESIYALGDLCLMLSEEKFPNGHPQLAQVAIQQGRNLAANFKRIEDEKVLEPFRYHDKGSMAIISKYNAVVDLPKHSFKGFLAWLTWLFIHIIPLVGFGNKVQLALDWFRLFITNNPSIRLILFPKRNTGNGAHMNP